MLIVEEFESGTKKLDQLLGEMLALNGKGAPPAINADWMKLAIDLLGRTNTLMADPRFATLKSSPQIHRYRIELLRLKDMVELGRQKLLAQRKSIRTEQARLKQLSALTGTLRSIQ